MALDEALLQSVQSGRSGYLRLYGWRQATLSLGYAQSLSASTDPCFCADHGIAVVRRVTGGRAVLHRSEHTYALALPYAALAGAVGLRDCYRFVGTSLCAALGACGIPAERRAQAPPRGVDRAVCFASAQRDEIELAGRKLVGSAQRRGPRGFLQHGSILLAADVDLHLRATGQTAEGAAPWVGLTDAGYADPGRTVLAAAVAREISSRLGLSASPGLPGDVSEIARELAARHGSAAWIGRVP